VAEEVVCYKDRIIIPAKLRPQVLKTIHAAHQGVSGMISRVEDTMFWPGNILCVLYNHLTKLPDQLPIYIL
jgi:hypothetical protein